MFVHVCVALHAPCASFLCLVVIMCIAWCVQWLFLFVADVSVSCNPQAPTLPVVWYHSTTNPYSDSYNSRHASVKDGRPAVDLAAYPQAQQFKESHILAHIAAHDRAHHDFYRWLRILHNDVFGFATWSSTKTNMPRPGHKRKAPEPSVGTTAANGDATAIPEKKLHAET